MKIVPILTEKTLKDAKEGKYTFWVPFKLKKTQIALLINQAFDVHTKKVRVINYKKEKKRKAGKVFFTKRRKKAIVTLSPKEEIALFGEKKKK
jgi:large subunit ribosomal protein L23